MVMKVAATDDGKRIIAGDWSGEVRLIPSADGKIISRLAANPPSLDVLLKETQAKATAAEAAAAKARREADAAQKLFQEKQCAARELSAAADAATKAAKSLAAETTTQEKGDKK